MQLFLPMVEDEEITGTMRGDNDNDLVSEFIGKINIFNMKRKHEYLFNIIYNIFLFYIFIVHCKAHCPVVR